MRLTADITLTIDGRAVTLRPSLAAAYRLEAKHGFPAIADGIVGGNLTIIKDVIHEAGDYPGAVTALLDEIEESGVVRLHMLEQPLLDLLAALAGYDDDQPDQKAPAKPKSKAKPITYKEHFERLFEIGTGWLGWSAAETWAATPAEILAGQKGRVDMLNAIFGGKKSGAEKRKNLPLADKIRLTMASLGAKTVKREDA